MPVPADVFRVVVGAWDGTGPDQEVGRFSTLNLSMSLDAGTTLTLDFSGTSPTAQVVDELVTDVWVYRDGVALARCRVVQVDQTFGPSGEDEVSVTASDYKILLNNRHVQSDLTYSSTPQADIVWGLIQHAQAQTNGDLGITAGTLNSGAISRDRSYFPGDNIGSLLSNLSNVIDGPWFGIDGDLVLDVQPYDSFPTKATPIVLGATARSLSRKSGAATFGNFAWVDGGEGTVPATAAAATLATDPRGRWERVESHSSVTRQTTLQQHADGLVEEAWSPIATWSCDIDIARYLSDADYAPGDFVEIVVPPSTVAPIGTPVFSVTGQVMSVNVTLDASGAATASVECVEIPA